MFPGGASPLPTVCVTLSPPPEGGGMRPVSALLSGTGLNPSPQQCTLSPSPPSHFLLVQLFPHYLSLYFLHFFQVLLFHRFSQSSFLPTVNWGGRTGVCKLEDKMSCKHWNIHKLTVISAIPTAPKQINDSCERKATQGNTHQSLKYSQLL